MGPASHLHRPWRRYLAAAALWEGAENAALESWQEPRIKAVAGKAAKCFLSSLLTKGDHHAQRGFAAHQGC